MVAAATPSNDEGFISRHAAVQDKLLEDLAASKDAVDDLKKQVSELTVQSTVFKEGMQRYKTADAAKSVLIKLLVKGDARQRKELLKNPMECLRPTEELLRCTNDEDAAFAALSVKWLTPRGGDDDDDAPQARAKPQRARRGYAPVPLALQKNATMAMIRACHSTQAFSQEALSSDELFSGLAAFGIEVGALQRCLGATGKEPCVRLCRAGLAARREIEAQVQLLLAAGAGVPELLDYIRGGTAPWGAYSCNRGSDYMLMLAGVALVAPAWMKDAFNWSI